jgi:hypothetical protein
VLRSTYRRSVAAKPVVHFMGRDSSGDRYRQDLDPQAAHRTAFSVSELEQLRLDRRVIKSQKYTLLSRNDDLTPNSRRFRALLEANQPLNVAYLLKLARAVERLPAGAGPGRQSGSDIHVRCESEHDCRHQNSSSQVQIAIDPASTTVVQRGNLLPRFSRPGAAPPAPPAACRA